MIILHRAYKEVCLPYSCNVRSLVKLLLEIEHHGATHGGLAKLDVIYR